MNATQLGTLAATGAVIAHRHVACGTNVARAWFSGTLAESLNAILYAFAVTECDSSLQPVAITEVYDDQHAAHIPTCDLSPGRRSTLPAPNLSEAGCSGVNSS